MNRDELPQELREHQDFPEFWSYHNENPSTYKFFVDTARRAKEKGYGRAAINHLIEIGRWEHGRDFTLASGFNHNFKPLYSRLIMAQERDLDGFFEVRRLVSLPGSVPQTALPSSSVAAALAGAFEL